MTAGPAIVVCQFGELAHQAFADILAAEPGFELVRVEPSADRQTLTEALTGAHVFQIPATRSDVPPGCRVDDALLAEAPNILMVSSSGAGYDTIDVDACTRSGVLAVNQAGGNAEAVAEHALGMMLCLSKKMIQTDRAMRRGPDVKRIDFMGHDIRRKVLGIIGLGHVGTRLAHLCARAFDMEVLAHDPYLADAVVRERGAQPVTLDALLRTADFVSLNCPRSDETVGLIGQDALRAMKPDAYLITTARGGIHDEDALVEALRSGEIAGAGLDVWADEPPPPSHPLLAFDNVLVTAHTAGVTHEARRQIAAIAAEQIIAVFSGKPAPRLLNPEVWDRFTLRAERLLSVVGDGVPQRSIHGVH